MGHKKGPHLQITKYPLPAYLRNIFTVSSYARWLKIKAQNLRHRDLRRKLPCALKFSVAAYRGKLHAAVMNKGQTDPYTGEAIDWTLSGGQEISPGAYASTAVSGPDAAGFNKALYLSPAVDHIDPDSDELELEICTRVVNACKTVLNPEEFIALCRKVVAYRDAGAGRRIFGEACKYQLPPFLQGICTVATYEHWIDVKAEDIYKRDLALKRPYALSGSKAFYKRQPARKNIRSMRR